MRMREWLALAAVLVAAEAVKAGETQGDTVTFALRDITANGVGQRSLPVPRDAVQVFLHLGEAYQAKVEGRHIAVDYQFGGVLFDRTSGEPVRRCTVADGWFEKRPPPFPEPVKRNAKPFLVGPGVLVDWRAPTDRTPLSVAASVEVAGRRWQAFQPSLNTLQQGVEYPEIRTRFGTWSGILRAVNEKSCVEATGGGRAAKRYTTADGLASNVVTHLVVSRGTLWAACVDIYDPEKKAWGPGGLCRYNAETDRWERINAVAGRPVRWVTLLQAVGDDLWVGFREGDGVTGDQVVYGMGLYPGNYRPVAKAVVLARLSKGAWSAFSRAPIAGAPASLYFATTRSAPQIPAEVPRSLAVSDNGVLLYSTIQALRHSGNWDVPLDGHISFLDPKSETWRVFEAQKDFDADVLTALVAEDGECLVTSNRGLHRWDAAAATWRSLDPKGELKNPAINGVLPRGNEVWVAYTNQSFGVLGAHGLSVYDEEKKAWSSHAPEVIGTGCPVRRMAALPNGDVWVVFAERAWLYAAAESPYYPRERQAVRRGVGRFANGKWEFPVTVALPDAPVATTHGAARPGLFGPADAVFDITSTGDQLIVQTPTGIYVGPGNWRRVFEGTVTRMELSEDGQAIYFFDAHAKPENPREMKRGRYDPRTGRITFDVLRDISDSYAYYAPRVWLETHEAGDRWYQQAVRVPVAAPGEWCLMPLDTQGHRVVQTPAALWIASRGQLIRIDRKRLDKALGA